MTDGAEIRPPAGNAGDPIPHSVPPDFADEREWETRPNVLLERHPFLIGYLVLAAITVAILVTNLTVFAISFLLLYLISDFLTNDVRRWIPWAPKWALFLLLYLTIAGFVAFATWKFLPAVVRRLPAAAEELQADVKNEIERLNAQWDLDDYVDLQDARESIVPGIGTTLGALAKKLSSVYKDVIYFVFALVINLLLYHDSEKIDRVFGRRPDGLTNFIYRFVAARIQIFYFYFKRVMGGQIIISAINTALSSAFIVGLGLPHKAALIAAIYVFGLFPIVGNLVSNSLVTLTALFSIGPVGAAVCLGLLVGAHKLEYFLNSRIIGEIVDVPMVVTLTALIVCEVALGVIGLLLAIPLMLSVRHELDHIPGLPADRRAHYTTARDVIERSQVVE